jgi:Fe2+ or Zn2+ uptake regulation protein
MAATAQKSFENSNTSGDLFESAMKRVRALRLKVTDQRKEIVATLAESHRPLSCEEVFQGLRGESKNLVTVYRALALLETTGLVKKYDLGDGIRRYRLTVEGQEQYFVHCRACGSLEAIEGFFFEKKVFKLLADKGYRFIQNSLSIQALCSACQK